MEPSANEIDWDSQPLGQVSDAKLAEELGVSIAVVVYNRRNRNIAAAFDRRQRFDIDWDAQPLGQVSDAELARSLGVSQTTVRNQRMKRKIPLFDKYAKYR